MTTHGYSGINYDRQVENTNTSTLHKMKETYWTTKQAVIQKLGKKEDEHVVASDQELDTKLEIFRAIQRSSMELLRVVERYQDRLCVVSQEENAMGRFLKTNSSHDKTRAGKMMAAVGKSQSFAAQQRLALRVPLVRLYQEVETFRYRAISDTLVTINRMEGARTEYRGALLWMKNVSEELDPDTFKQLEKFRKVQGQVRKTKGRFDKLKLDVMQKVDLLAASRCNMFSHVLANYQSTLLHFWEKTSRTMSAVAESFKGYQHYEFNMLKDLAEPSSKGPTTDGEEQEVHMDTDNLDSEMLLALGDEYKDDQRFSMEEALKNQVNKSFSEDSLYKTGNMGKNSQPFEFEQEENPSLLPTGIQDSSRGWKKKIDETIGHIDNQDLLSENYEENDTDKDDMTLLNEILNAPSTGEDEFTQEWQAVFGSSPAHASQTLLSTESDQGKVFMPSSLLDIAAPVSGKHTCQGGITEQLGQPISQLGMSSGKDGIELGQQASDAAQQEIKSKSQSLNKQIQKVDMSSWFNLFADLDPLSDPDAVGKQDRNQNNAA